MMRPVLAVSIVGLLAAGCGPDPCVQASERIVECLKSTNCATLTNANAKSACMAAQSSTLTGSTSSSTDCTGDELAAANLINGCSALDPEQLCTACLQ